MSLNEPRNRSMSTVDALVQVLLVPYFLRSSYTKPIHLPSVFYRIYLDDEICIVE